MDFPNRPTTGIVMLSRLIARWRWRRSIQFDRMVRRKCEEVRREWGDGALDHARRKAGRHHQPVRRKWLWRAVVAMLEAETDANR